jgi:hypothetical protein
MLLQSTHINTSSIKKQNTIPAHLYPVCNLTYTRDSWVKLLHNQSDYRFDEALLLCQETANTWVAWVPDCGEIRLDKSEFYC